MKDLGFQELNGIFRNGFVKSVQPVSKALNGLSVTAALSQAVDVNNSLLLWNGATVASGANPTECLFYATLTDGSTVTFVRKTNNATDTTAKVTVLEFYPGVIRSVQRGTISISGTTTSGTATVTAVNTTKAMVTCGGFDMDVGTVGDGWVSVVLTNSTTVTANRGNGAAIGSVSTVIAYEVIEWY